jgi:hypothetical protein
MPIECSVSNTGTEYIPLGPTLCRTYRSTFRWDQCSPDYPGVNYKQNVNLTIVEIEVIQPYYDDGL